MSAEKLQKSFVSTESPMSGEMTPKITQAGMVILDAAGNRFACGFSKDETALLNKNKFLPFARDVIQWREVCRASRSALTLWLNDTEAFKSHCDDILLTSEANMTEFSELFIDVFLAVTEIKESQVIVKEPKREKGSGPKKKASSRAKRRNTSLV